MKSLKDIKKFRIPMIIACIYWFISTVMQFDRLFFTYDSETVFMLLAKFLFLLLLMILCISISKAVKKVRSGERIWQRGFFIFKVHFFVMQCLLLVLWPGTWSWDDLWVLDDISTYKTFGGWHHILTGLYQDLLLQILPFPGGIIVLQVMLVSFCVAFVITKTEVLFEIRVIKNYIIDILLKIFPFLLPPIIMYQFSGYRMGIYIYIEIVMLIMSLSMLKENKKWSICYLIFFCILCVLTATWRTESFIYIPFILIVLAMAKDTVITRSSKLICSIMFIAGCTGIIFLQNRALGDSNYQIISLLGPCAELVRIADVREDYEELAAIDKVADTAIILKESYMDGEQLYWNTGCIRNRNNDRKDDYTLNEYNGFLMAFFRLSIKYPKTVLFERLSVFIKGSGITGETHTNIYAAASIFDNDSENRAARKVLEKNWIAFSPIVKDFRKVFIRTLGALKSDGTYIGIMQMLLWNALIPELIILLFWVELLIKKKWRYAFLYAALLMRFVIVVMTEPAGRIMYFLSFYLLGYFLLICRIFKWWEFTLNDRMLPAVHYLWEKE